MNNHEEPKQLWIVSGDNQAILWSGRGSQTEAVEEAMKAGAYTSDSTLHLYAVAMEIIIEPEQAS